jgi:predicted AAA+ superfamily ATPase
MDLISLSKELFSQKLIARPRYYQELDATIKAHQITIIQGQRRVGKSSLVLGYLQNLPLNPKTIFFLNKELDSEGKIASAKELNQLFEAYVEENGQPEYIFIDEIQDIKNWENFVRARFALKKEKIIISGSNSQLLSGELATYLTGRYLTFDVFPLGFDEFILFKGKGEKTELLQEYLRR